MTGAAGVSDDTRARGDLEARDDMQVSDDPRVRRVSAQRPARRMRQLFAMPAAWAIALLVLALTPQRSRADGEPFPTIAGWRLAGPAVTYTPDNLWDFIDGAAESYLAYSFVDLQVGEYVNPESVAVRAELYRHADPDNAFGIYSQERAPDCSFLDVGAQGYEGEGILNFFSGKYYVKLSTHQKGPAAAAGLRTIAGRIDAHLAEGSTLPAGVKGLPLEGKQPNTEGFVAQHFLGYGFLHHTYTARYDRGLQIFVMEYPTADSAAGALRRLLAVAPGTQTGPDQYRISDPNNGPIAIARQGPILCGTVGATDAATETRYITLLRQSSDLMSR